MPNYSYTAKSLSGEVKNGIIEVGDEHELARLLRQEGYILISSVLLEKKEAARSKLNPFSVLGGPSLAEKMVFIRNLGLMISAGIALPRILSTLSVQSKSKKMKTAIEDIADKVTGGKSFSGALAFHTDIFPELFVSMIEVGEESGTLEEVCRNLTLQMEREYELRSKIKGAMFYPAIVISAMVGIGILMLIVVVPELAATFAELNLDLPWTTRLVIASGTFMSSKWYLLPFIMLAVVLVLRAVLSTAHGRRAKDFIFLHSPIVGPIVKQSNSAYITRTLGSLLSSGVPIVQALGIVSRSVGNSYFKAAIASGEENIKKGGKLSEVLGRYPKLFSLALIQMVQVGEETGQTSDILNKVAGFFEEEVTNATKNMSSVIEPILMLIIGGIVGFFAVSMLQPMYSMLDAI